MEIEEIVNYIMETPSNPNPWVLRGMLEQLNQGGSGGKSMIVTVTYEQNIFECDKTAAEILEGFNNGLVYFLFENDDTSIYNSILIEVTRTWNGYYKFVTSLDGNCTEYMAETLEDHPYRNGAD